MTSLTVWVYPTAFGAGTGELHLRSLVERNLIVLHDAATIVWMPHDAQPRVRPVEHLTTRAAGRGAFWGSLVGLVLLNPVAGAAAGAGASALAQKARRAGLDDDFVDAVRRSVAPGTSALLVLSSRADQDAVGEVLAHSEAYLVHAELSREGRELLDELRPPGHDAVEDEKA